MVGPKVGRDGVQESRVFERRVLPGGSLSRRQGPSSRAQRRLFARGYKAPAVPRQRRGVARSAPGAARRAAPGRARPDPLCRGRGPRRLRGFRRQLLLGLSATRWFRGTGRGGAVPGVVRPLGVRRAGEEEENKPPRAHGGPPPQDIAVAAYGAEVGHQVRVPIDLHTVRGTSFFSPRAQDDLLVDEPGLSERPERGEQGGRSASLAPYRHDDADGDGRGSLLL